MGFISMGSKIIIPEYNGTGSDKSYLYKRMNSNGTFSDVNWGSLGTDFDTPISSSTWTTYNSYKYIQLGVVRQTYSSVHKFDRNMRFDSSIRLSNTVLPVTSDLSGIEYITALVKGSLTEDSSSLINKLVDEFTSQIYQNVLAIGTMKKVVDDYRPINVDVNDVITVNGSAETTMDYSLPTTEAVYLINIAIATNSSMSGITSLTVNTYQQEFTEFYGNNEVAAGSIGQAQISSNYRPELSRNNMIIKIDSSQVIDNSDTTSTIVLSPDYIVSLDKDSIYNMTFSLGSISKTVANTTVSLGYFDVVSNTYVSTGTKYAISSTDTNISSFNNTVQQVIFMNNKLYMKKIQDL